MADIVTLDGRRITSKGITSGSNFRVPPLAEAPCRFGSAGQAMAAQPQDLQQQVHCFPMSASNHQGHSASQLVTAHQASPWTIQLMCRAAQCHGMQQDLAPAVSSMPTVLVCLHAVLFCTCCVEVCSMIGLVCDDAAVRLLMQEAVLEALVDALQHHQEAQEVLEAAQQVRHTA